MKGNLMKDAISKYINLDNTANLIIDERKSSITATFEDGESVIEITTKIMPLHIDTTKHLSRFEKVKLVSKLYNEEGMSQVEIAKIIGCSQASVSITLKDRYDEQIRQKKANQNLL